MTPLPVDKHYWAQLQPPLAPSHEDVLFYRRHLKEGDTLLLGCTRQLIPLSDYQMDIDPLHETSTVIKQAWQTNQKKYTNIMGDGVLNFTQELCDQVLDMCSRCSSVFIARVFNYKLETMRIAAYFPKKEDFKICPASVTVFEKYTFFVWQF